MPINNIWHYDFDKTSSGYYHMVIKQGPAPYKNPKNKGYWIFIKTIDGEVGKKWISGDKPLYMKIKEALKNKILIIREKILFYFFKKNE